MYYTIYKTTNQINGKIYIGSHKTEDLDDDYLGSGKYLKYAIEKHGIKNFTKEILYIFDNSEDMFAKEAEIVNEDFLAEENTYNLKVGGYGGFDYLNSNTFDNPTHSKTHMKMMHKAGEGKRDVRLSWLFEHDTEFKTNHKTKVGKAVRKFYANGGVNGFSNKVHSDETKKKISDSCKGIGAGSNNSQYGTCWIHNNTVSKKIKKEYIDRYLSDGWHKGRKINF